MVRCSVIRENPFKCQKTKVSEDSRSDNDFNEIYKLYPLQLDDDALLKMAIEKQSPDLYRSLYERERMKERERQFIASFGDEWHDLKEYHQPIQNLDSR